MENLTISQVVKQFDVTPRMLRYYEKLGLIKTIRREDYAYRVYDMSAVRRLQQIIILRKLRIPLKQIAIILNDEEQCESLRLLRDNLMELDEEIASLDKIRSILKEFVDRLDESIKRKAHLDLLEDSALVKVVGTLSLSKTTLKENTSMTELNKAGEILNKALNVRIILLPPCTVASYQFIGENPEENAGDVVNEFVQKSRLYEIKPDARMFGFNHPNPGILENGSYGYEIWVTIPDDMEPPAPLTKKHFAGGLYAVLAIPFGEFQLWDSLTQWVNNSDVYEPNWSELGLEIMGGCLEEHLNWVYASYMGWPENGVTGQLDLMLPIKRKDGNL